MALAPGSASLRARRQALALRLSVLSLMAAGLLIATLPWLGGWAVSWLIPVAFAAGLWIAREQNETASEGRLDELTAFKSRLAHEINNPLSIVMEQLNHALNQLERTSQLSGREHAAELRLLADAALTAAERIRQVVREFDDTVPLHPRRAVRTRSGPVPAPPRARILVIDDERQVAMSLKRILRRHNVSIATSGFEATQLLAQESFDVIISDVMMPEPGGIDVYERFARTQPELAKRFVFVSGGSYSLRAREFLASIPNQRLPKPVDPLELERAIAAVRSGMDLEAAG